MERNRLDYDMKSIVVTYNNVEQLFAQYPTKRQIRTGQRKKLLNDVLNKGKTFPVMYVNKGSRLSNKYVVLDGNHRLEALRIYLEQNPEKKVEIQLGVYNIEDPELERQKFLELNNIVKPSSDDIIQQYIEDNEFLRELLQQVDVSVYATSSRPLKVRNLMNAYIHAKAPKWNATILTGQDMIKIMENYGQEDIDVIKHFLVEYQDIFGVLTKDSLYANTTTLQIFFRIWYQNRDIEYKKLVKKFRKLMNEQILREASGKGGISQVMDYSDKFVKFLNKGRGYKFKLEN